MAEINEKTDCTSENCALHRAVTEAQALGNKIAQDDPEHRDIAVIAIAIDNDSRHFSTKMDRVQHMRALEVLTQLFNDIYADMVKQLRQFDTSGQLPN